MKFECGFQSHSLFTAVKSVRVKFNQKNSTNQFYKYKNAIGHRRRLKLSRSYYFQFFFVLTHNFKTLKTKLDNKKIKTTK
jgi:hypothetical protein